MLFVFIEAVAIFHTCFCYVLMVDHRVIDWSDYGYALLMMFRDPPVIDWHLQRHLCYCLFTSSMQFSCGLLWAGFVLTSAPRLHCCEHWKLIVLGAVFWCHLGCHASSSFLCAVSTALHVIRMACGCWNECCALTVFSDCIYQKNWKCMIGLTSLNYKAPL